MPEHALVDAIVAILRDAGEELHWTVVLDRALRGGHVEPSPQARTTVLSALAAATREGVVAKTSTGTYRLPGESN